MVDIFELPDDMDDEEGRYDRILYLDNNEITVVKNAALARKACQLRVGELPFDMDINFLRVPTQNVYLDANMAVVERVIGLLDHTRIFGSRTYDAHARELARRSGALAQQIEWANTAWETAHSPEFEAEFRQVFGDGQTDHDQTNNNGEMKW